MDLSTNAANIITSRYLQRNPESGELMEDIQGMVRRVSKNIGEAHCQPDTEEYLKLTEEYYKMISSMNFMPNSPTFTGAGTPLGQLAACFVLPIDDDIGKDSDSGIFSTLRNAALIQQSGGGIGFSFSRLRPKGDRIFKSSGVSSGPISFMKVFDSAFKAIEQGGTRRGANMAVMRVDHPDILQFIRCKSADENILTNFNISVGITDDFMDKYNRGEDITFINPRNGQPWPLNDPDDPKSIKTTAPSARIMREIAKYAHHNGEPGVIFLTTMNSHNPMPHIYTIETTNPCGEQALGPYENCCLGSVNLSKHIIYTEGELYGKINWVKLAETIRLAVRFLDDVVTVNKYVPSVPRLREAALLGRRIGLGYMGLADALMACGVRYGDDDGLMLTNDITAWFHYNAMLASVDLSIERGPFPAIRGSIYGGEPLLFKEMNLSAQYIKGTDIVINWPYLVERIKKHGIRNAAVTTIAPTGTIGTIAGVEGYGIEPTFALSYSRIVTNSDGSKTKMFSASKLFERALKHYNMDITNPCVVEALKKGSCKDVEGIPDEIKRVFVTAGDLDFNAHIKTQAYVQCYLSNSVSKTINFPSHTTIEDIESAFVMAWNLGCRGLTVYVTGSRENIVLSSHSK
jgi:ribonucleoside-diphosphate reductase alpha chain